MVTTKKGVRAVVNVYYQYGAGRGSLEFNWGLRSNGVGYPEGFTWRGPIDLDKLWDELGREG